MQQYSLFVLCGTVLAWAQSTTTTYQRDINGRPVAVSKSTVDAEGRKTVELQETINGRTISRQQVSERVLRSDTSGKIVERIVQNFDPDGRPSGTERVVIEETAGADETKTVRQTVYRSAPNGPWLEEERHTSQTRTRNGTTNTEVTVERPDLNHRFAISERRSIVTSGDASNQSTTETVLRPDVSGRFTVSQRKEMTATTQNGETKTTTNVYENRGGYQPALIRQEVTTKAKRADGVEVTQTDTFLPDAAGMAQHASARPVLQEQQIVERRLKADGSFTETVSVRLPASANPGRLGDLRIVSESMCEGKCVTPPAAEAKPAAAEPKPAPRRQ